MSFRENKERFNRTKPEKIDWRKLRIKKHLDEYQEHISKASLSNEPSWAELVETMKTAAKDACGLEDTRSKTSQWMVGHEDRAREFKNGIQRAVKKWNEATNEAQRHNAREELKTVRKEYNRDSESGKQNGGKLS